jgi:hypothetical protein
MCLSLRNLGASTSWNTQGLPWLVQPLLYIFAVFVAVFLVFAVVFSADSGCVLLLLRLLLLIAVTADFVLACF